MWTVIFTVILGGIGWIIAKLLFEPLREIADLRRRAQECLIAYGDLSKDAPADNRYAAADAFRRIGAGLVSRHYAPYPWANWTYDYALNWLGWDIHSAGNLLISIGNATQSDGFSWANGSPLVMLVRQSLKLPSPEASSIERDLVESAVKPAPLHTD
jgi:HAMP domain-containing protein